MSRLRRANPRLVGRASSRTWGDAESQRLALVDIDGCMVRRLQKAPSSEYPRARLVSRVEEFHRRNKVSVIPDIQRERSHIAVHPRHDQLSAKYPTYASRRITGASPSICGAPGNPQSSMRQGE